MRHPPRHRSNRRVPARDETKIFAALEQAAAGGDMAALRLRAFVYLLRDGALRCKAATALNIEEVIKTPTGGRIQIVEEVVQRPCDENNHQQRTLLLSDRTRQAIADYLEVARVDGWLSDPDELHGPLWITSHHRGTQRRLSQRMASEAWRLFVAGLDVVHAYQLDDLVLSGRVELLKAAKGNADVLSQHASLTQQWARRYHNYTVSTPSTVREALAQIDRNRSK